MRLTIAIASLFVMASGVTAQPLAGLWDAVIHYDDSAVPFAIEFAGNTSHLNASFFNGNSITYRFDDYATELQVTPGDGVLQGTYGGKRVGIHAFEARPHHATAVSAQGPDVAGIWDVPTESAKGEHAWHLIVNQSGAEVSAAILRVDGDTGALTGHYDGGKFVLSHFDGARPLIAEIALRQDGTLALTLSGPRQPARQLVAVRAAEARTQGLPQPDDPAEHTGWKEPNQPLRFSFPDIDGHIVSNTDPRFKDKVIIVSVTGSWRPNCHDEAPFLVDLYRRYHPLGLEIVALFFVGRDGKVRVAHAGFAAAASGEFHTQLEREVTGLVERLLAEPDVNASAALK